MTYAEFVQAVMDEVGRGTSIQSYIDGWTSRTLRKVYRETKPWLAKRMWERDLTQGTRSYTMPPMISGDGVFLYLPTDGTTWTPLDVKPERTAILKYGPTDDGVPDLIVIQKQGFDVYPLPDATYKLRAFFFGYEDDPKYDASSDYESPLILEAPDLVLAGVKQQAFDFLQEYDFAQVEKTKFDEAYRDWKRLCKKRILSGVTSIWPSSDANGLEVRSEP